MCCPQLLIPMILTTINSHDLDKFLNSIGKNPAYIDLEANPPVGKDLPPDLAGLIPSDAVVLPDPPEKRASSQGPNENLISEKSNSAVNVSSSFGDPEKLVEEILEKTTSIVLSEIKEENMEKYREQLGTMVSNSIRKRLSGELKSILPFSFSLRSELIQLLLTHFRAKEYDKIASGNLLMRNAD
ncbi:Hypothetical predicted protein [Olea europaea subsp. europaea]|uniref:Uncharacterized protein n=1 Tax=Olea europaea subsp. europaea TaxID=158383 RepID=A0A8S0RWG5_OLEEU|nr:Hypothetical predicted protein [Olea europaea subsp. europaea]